MVSDPKLHSVGESIAPPPVAHKPATSLSLPRQIAVVPGAFLAQLSPCGRIGATDHVTAHGIRRRAIAPSHQNSHATDIAGTSNRPGQTHSRGATDLIDVDAVPERHVAGTENGETVRRPKILAGAS